MYKIKCEKTGNEFRLVIPRLAVVIGTGSLFVEVTMALTGQAQQ